MENVRLSITNILFSVAYIAVCSYFLNEAQTKCVTVFLDSDLQPLVNIMCPLGVVVLNVIAWFILLPLKLSYQTILYQLAACYRNLET